MAIIIGIDPGDKHVGFCSIELDSVGKYKWSNRHTETMNPPKCLDVLRSLGRGGDIAAVVVEEFRLYPWATKEQGFSQMKTCEMIGAIKLWREWFQPDLTLTLQSAQIKKPTFAVMRGRGYDLTPGTQHGKDAEAHLYHYMERTQNVCLEK